MFDIATCKCSGECNCPKYRKVPAAECAFLADQRSERKMMIGNIDLKETCRLQKRETRKRKKGDSDEVILEALLDLSSSTEDIPPVPGADSEKIKLKEITKQW